MISIQNLEKSYGRVPVLRGFSCSVESGKVTLLVGPNGAGKSTALKVVTGSLKPDGGEVLVSQVSVTRKPLEARRQISYLPQNTAFHPRLSVADVMAFYADVRGTPRRRISAEIERWGLSEHVRKKSGHLSGGLRQRLGLAVLMLAQAPVLILDEPGISLDPEWREEMQRILIDEARHGRTVLVATHLLGEWEARTDRCLLCVEGRIVRELDPHNLRTGPSGTLNIAAI